MTSLASSVQLRSKFAEVFLPRSRATICVSHSVADNLCYAIDKQNATANRHLRQYRMEAQSREPQLEFFQLHTNDDLWIGYHADKLPGFKRYRKEDQQIIEGSILSCKGEGVNDYRAYFESCIWLQLDSLVSRSYKKSVAKLDGLRRMVVSEALELYGKPHVSDLMKLTILEMASRNGQRIPKDWFHLLDNIYKHPKCRLELPQLDVWKLLRQYSLATSNIGGQAPSETVAAQLRTWEKQRTPCIEILRPDGANPNPFWHRPFDLIEKLVEENPMVVVQLPISSALESNVLHDFVMNTVKAAVRVRLDRFIIHYDSVITPFEDFIPRTAPVKKHELKDRFFEVLEGPLPESIDELQKRLGLKARQDEARLAERLERLFGLWSLLRMNNIEIVHHSVDLDEVGDPGTRSLLFNYTYLVNTAFPHVGVFEFLEPNPSGHPRSILRQAAIETKRAHGLGEHPFAAVDVDKYREISARLKLHRTTDGTVFKLVADLNWCAIFFDPDVEEEDFSER